MRQLSSFFSYFSYFSYSLTLSPSIRVKEKSIFSYYFILQDPRYIFNYISRSSGEATVTRTEKSREKGMMERSVKNRHYSSSKILCPCAKRESIERSTDNSKRENFCWRAMRTATKRNVCLCVCPLPLSTKLFPVLLLLFHV